MTEQEQRADELRRSSAWDRGIPSGALLPWESLKGSEQRQWLEAVASPPQSTKKLNIGVNPQ